MSQVLSAWYSVLSTLLLWLTLVGLPSRLGAADSFVDGLEALAAKCLELGLTEQATITRSWKVERRAGRQYLFLPIDDDPAAPKSGALETVQQWYRRFKELRRERAAALFEQAKQLARDGKGAEAYALLFESLREDPDHAEARRVLGYVKQAGAWRIEGWERAAARPMTFAHPKLGWPARSYWSLETPHYRIVSNHSQRELVEAGQQLESLHTLWRQIFFAHWSTSEALLARINGINEPLSMPRPKMQVVLFKSREEYAARVAEAHPKARSTLGLYDDQQRIAYFFAGDASVIPTWYHEATHQLFQEAVPDSVANPGSERDFWALEGVALYMESLASRGTYWTVGGCESGRLQYARYRVMSGDLDVGLGPMTALSREAIQQSDDIGRIYSAAAGLTHFFMDGERGTYRSHFIDHLASVYRGEDPRAALLQKIGLSSPAIQRQYREFLDVTDDDLEGIPDPASLLDLSLCRSHVTDAGLKRLAGTRKLKWLDLSFTAASDEGLKLFAKNSGLKQLFLEGTRVTETSLPTIAALKQLEELDLSRLPITDEGLFQLRSLRQLELLHLSGTQVTPEGVKKLKVTLPKLDCRL